MQLCLLKLNVHLLFVVFSHQVWNVFKSGFRVFFLYTLDKYVSIETFHLHLSLVWLLAPVCLSSRSLEIRQKLVKFLLLEILASSVYCLLVFLVFEIPSYEPASRPKPQSFLLTSCLIGVLVLVFLSFRSSEIHQILSISLFRLWDSSLGTSLSRFPVISSAVSLSYQLRLIWIPTAKLMKTC